MNEKIAIKVNGRAVALNPFVRRIIGNVVLAAVLSLDRIPRPWKRINISLQAGRGQEGEK